jgi:hypothetical protein
VHMGGIKGGNPRERMNRITIADVAREAGVSRQLVVRASAPRTYASKPSQGG